MRGYMNVVLALGNRYHAGALARRLVELTDRIRIIYCEAGDQKVNDIKEPFFVVDDELAAACSSASALLERLRAVYTEKTGRRLCSADNKRPIIIGAGSAAGGSGTTAAAVMLARLLAGKLKGETALVFAGGSGNPMIYLEGEGYGSSRELDYVLRNNVETDIMKYVKRDRYGPLTVITSANPEIVIDRMAEKINLEAAVIDFGSSRRSCDCHIFMETASKEDRRAARFEEYAASHDAAAGPDIFILNKAAAINRKGRLFCIPLDRESFSFLADSEDPEAGCRIEIAMDGIFSAAMRQVAGEVIEIIKNKGYQQETDEFT